MKNFLAALLLLGYICLNAQDITGQVNDPNEGGLVGATAMLLNASDSVLSLFAITDAEGKFIIKKAFNGEYILQINFVGYKTHTQKISVKGEDVTIGQINMESDVLDELVVEAERVPIEMKKDTIEYNAAAFKTEPNAVVEDLLKKLPGVEVDRDGSIKAQGEDVNKVLVDGKEFFGDDPQMATKNLAADAVDKVQVFDRKSEFSQFSGIDDGNDEKTINIALKDDRKQGTFGRVAAGGGTDETYKIDANINQFRKDNQFSLVAKKNNINEQAFSISDYISFMGGLSNISTGGGGRFSINSSVPIGDDLSSGFVNTTMAGVNYNRDFSEKTELQSNYLFSRINNLQRVNSETSYLDGSQDIDQYSNSESTADMHQLSLNLKQKLSEASDIQVRNSISFNQGESLGDSRTITTSFTDETTDSYSNSQNEALNLNTRLIYRQRFGKPGRTLVTEGRITRNEDDAEGTLSRDSDNDLLDLNQETLDRSLVTTLGGEVAFTEPLSKSVYLEVRYEFEDTNDLDDREVYDISGSRILDPNQSLLFERKYTANTAGASFNYIKDKFRFTIGTNYQTGDLIGTVAGDDPIKRNFNAGLPYVRTSYDFSNSVRLSFNYSTRQQIPTVRQLQPVLDLSNPISQYIGNPDLDASFVHTARVNFNLFDQFTSKSFFSFFSTTITENNVVNSRSREPGTNVQNVRPLNSGSAVAITGYAAFSGRIRFAKMKYRISNRINRSTANTVTEGTAFATRSTNNTVDASIENARKEKVDWIIGMRYTVNNTRSEDLSSANQELENTAYYNDITWYLPKKWSFTSNFDLTRFGNAGIGGGNDVALWKTSIQRDFLKKDRGQLRFSVFDLLNQNQGINQTANNLLIQEQRIISLGRYYMITLTYKLSNYESGGGVRFGGRRG